MVPSRKMRYANWFFCGLDGEIRPKLTFFWPPHRGPLLQKYFPSTVLFEICQHLCMKTHSWPKMWFPKLKGYGTAQRGHISGKSQQGPLRRIWSLGALGEGSGWDLRVRPSAAAAESAASGNVGTWKSWNLVWNGSIWLDMAWYYRQIDRTDVAHLFCFQEIIKKLPRVQTRGPDASSFSSLKN